MEKNSSVKNSYWKDAAKAGGLIGLVTLLMSNIQIMVGNSMALNLVSLVITALMIYYFGRNRSLKYGKNEGFTYGESMGYIMAMMLFAGFVEGLGLALVQNLIAPDYFREIMEQSLESAGSFDMDTESGQRFREMYFSLIKNPIVLVIGGIISMLFYGGLIGLVVSAFIRRRPDIFADDNDTPPTE